MGDGTWEKAANAADLKEGVPVSVKVGKRTILLIRSGEAVYATTTECPHNGAPLWDGVIIDHILTCSRHTARFDVSNGKLQSPPALDDLPSYSVKVEKGKVYIAKVEKPRTEIKVNAGKGTYVIVGGGAAGNAAALTLRREGFEGRVVMATGESEIPYDRTNLSKDFLAGKLERRGMPLKPVEFYRSMGIEVLKNYRLITVDIENRALHFAGGEYLEYDKMLLATGGIPRTPDLPGIDFFNVFLLRSLSDAERIASALADAGTILVIGAGFIGLEVAAALRARDLNVHVVAPETILMEKTFGDEIGKRIKQLHLSRGVKFHLGVTALEIIGDTKVRGAVLSDGSRVEADIVIAGTGIVPAVSYLEDTDLLENNEVPVDSMMQTKADGIFAAGDIAALPDPISGGMRRVEHWIEAERQGQHAARSMLGFQEDYREVPFFWTKQYDTVFRYVGYAAEYDSIEYRGETEDDSFLAGFYKNGKLFAAAGIGKTGEIIILSEMLRAGIPVPPDTFHDETTDLRELFDRGR